MSTIQIKSRKACNKELDGFWDQGFRPFFFAAIIFSFISIFYWGLIYAGYVNAPGAKACATEWHAHQMIFGYAMAVIAGFLLTAVPNWTNTSSNGGMKLASIFSFWLISRILFLAGDSFLALAAISDIIFGILLFYAVALPIIKTKSWGQSGVMAKLILLITSNIFFYLSILGFIDGFSKQAIYSGFFIIIGLILTISARVFPNFARIATGLDYISKETVKLRVTAVLVFLFFYVNEVFVQNEHFSAGISLLLFLIYSRRIYQWHHIKIWSKPLIWSLYLAVSFIAMSFLLLSLSYILPVPKLIAIHCMAIGGIGFSTAGFMVRVSLGHSGKNIHSPPRHTSTVLRLLFVSLFFRIALPLINMQNYLYWILLSQLFWVLAFFILLFVCFENKKQIQA